MPTLYPWTRFWVPRGSTVAITPEGFLDDPSAFLGSATSPHTVALSTLLHIPCLILLGESQSGKTTDVHPYTTGQAPREEGQPIRLGFNLGAYGSSDTYLRQKVFAHPTFEAWRTGDHTLELFLDGFDDCLAQLPQLADIVVHELETVDRQRLHLRIVSRTSMWPADFETQLRELWPTDAVQVYELTRLRRIDVHQAAACEGWDADTFLQAIAAAGVGLLASSPVTLALLMRIYREQGTVPATQTDLYRDGCLELCKERRRQRHVDRVNRSTPDQRFITAARMAAYMVFGRRSSIWLGDSNVTPGDAMPLHYFLDGSETAHEHAFPITEQVLQDTLDTGLFGALAADRIGWVHPSYAHMLAAEYLTRHGLSVPQIRGLIEHRLAADWTVAPPLRQVAAWLAALNPEISHEIARADPDVLLESGILDLSARDRATVIDGLFARIEVEQAPDLDHRLYRHGRTLTHPQLAQQVRPYLTAPQRSPEVQRAALDLVETCRLNDLQTEVIDVVLDAQRAHGVRVRAAHVLDRLDDSPTVERLRPLVLDNGDDDPDHDLKGACVSVLWPQHLTLAELLGTLVSSRASQLGSYEWFLTSKFAQSLALDDLAPALAWLDRQMDLALTVAGLDRQPVEERPVAYLDKIEPALMLQAWQRLDSPGVLPIFTRLACKRLTERGSIVRGRHAPAFATAFATDDARRRTFLDALIPHLTEPILDEIWMARRAHPLVQPADLPWLIAQLQAAATLDTQRAIFWLISTNLDGLNDHQRADLADALRHPALAELAQLVEQAVHRWMAVQPQDHAEQPAVEATVPDAAADTVRTDIEALIQACEAGDTAQWWQIHAVLRRSGATPYLLRVRELEPDLTALPGWSLLDPALQHRVCLMAQQYLETQQPAVDVGDWIDDPSAAGYWALRLLHEQLPAAVAQIRSPTWDAWLPVVTAYPLDWNREDTEAYRALWDHIYAVAPEAWFVELHRLLTRPTYIGWAPDLVEWATNLKDPRMVAVFERSVQTPQIHPELLRLSLATLLDQHSALARSVAEALLVMPTPAENPERERAVVAAQVLLTHTDDAGWSTVWPAIQQDAAFGRQVLVSLLQRMDRTGISPIVQLTEDQLTDLYLWLAPYLDPGGQDAPPIGGRTRDLLEHWRNAIVTQLRQRGAAPALDRLATAFPDRRWLRTYALQAQQVMLEHSWHPISRDHLRGLITNAQARVVQSAAHLQEVVLESLQRFADELDEGTWPIQNLWNTGVPTTPKNEVHLSNNLAYHLTRDLAQRGIVVNREVEISPSRRGGLGDHVDIRVDAQTKRPGRDGDEKVSVMIEVKGSWHRDVRKAMKKQLVDQYLKGPGNRAGIYLVGWFACERWTNTGTARRRQAFRWGTIETLRQQLEEQAAELTTETRRIRAVVLDTSLQG